MDGNTSLPGNRVRVSAQVPVAELDDYQASLKSLTAGEGSFTMSFDHYSRVPPEIQKQLVDKHQSSH
ncbi:MAG TPA: hypothetical protein ENK16_07470 [Chromatiales bacterium]|nr:hypothetical protein [Chromatiales bacterium]